MLLLLASCVTYPTKFTYLTSFPKLVKGSDILYLPAKQVSTSQDISFFYTAEELLKKTNKLSYLPQEEYVLISEGISRTLLYSDTLSKKCKKAIFEKTNFRYLIQVEVLDISKGVPKEYNQPYVMYDSRVRDNGSDRKAVLIFTVHDVKNYPKEITRVFKVETKVNKIIGGNNSRNEYEVSYDVKSSASAIEVAFKKGIKKIRRKIINLE